MVNPDQKTPPRTAWYAFIDEAAEVNLKILREVLVAHDPMEETFVGHAIPDVNRFDKVIHTRRKGSFKRVEEAKK